MRMDIKWICISGMTGLLIFHNRFSGRRKKKCGKLISSHRKGSFLNKKIQRDTPVIGVIVRKKNASCSVHIPGNAPLHGNRKGTNETGGLPDWQKRRPTESFPGRRDIQVETFSVYKLVGLLQRLGFFRPL